MVGKMIVIIAFKSCLSNLITNWTADESTYTIRYLVFKTFNSYIYRKAEIVTYLTSLQANVNIILHQIPWTLINNFFAYQFNKHVTVGHWPYCIFAHLYVKRIVIHIKRTYEVHC